MYEAEWNPDLVVEFAHAMGSSCETDMIDTKSPRTTQGLKLVVLVLSTVLGLGSYAAHAAEVHTTAAGSKPVGFADIVANVKAAVIAVTVKLENDVNLENKDGPDAPSESQPFGPNSPLYRYFFGGPQQSPPSAPSAGTKMALGSGFFISADGYAVTNNHVVQHGVSFMIATDEGATYKARVVGADLRSDLALLKVDGRNDFPYVKLAGHEPRIGDWVIAVGDPYGLGGTVTAGIVSALGRRIGTDTYDDFIQIDAPINRGNSGGPSFDLDGEVVGVNTAIFSPSGGSVGIGFAIPSTTVKPVIEQLRAKGVVTRGALGVEVQPVTPDIAQAVGLKRVQGALVAEAQHGGPAANAGIMPGDVIVAVDNTPISKGADLAARIGSMSPGTSATIQIIRDGSERTFSIRLGELPVTPFKAPAEPPSQQPSHLGLTLAPLKGTGSAGVAIVKVDPNGVAAEKGLTAGDVILGVANQPVSSPADVHKAIAEAEKTGKQDVLFRIKTQDERVVFVALPLPAHQPTLWARIQSWIHSL